MSRPAFSFTEILFAVMILGIGFIMVAAMFPVAIKQTQGSNDETIGAAVARAGVNYMTQVAQSNWPGFQTTSMLSPTFDQNRTSTPGAPKGSLTPRNGTYPILTGFPVGTSVDLRNAVFSCYDMVYDNQTPLAGVPPWHSQQLWSMVSPQMIQAVDPRYAWVALYSRDIIETQQIAGPTFTYAPYAQVIAIAVRAETHQTFSASRTAPDVSDLLAPTFGTSSDEPSLMPSLAQGATLYIQTIGAGATATILSSGINLPSTGNANGNTAAYRRAAEGAYVVIATDNVNPAGLVLVGTAPQQKHGMLNGHVYRLGGPNPDPSAPANSWEFAPGNGITAGDWQLLQQMGAAPNGSGVNFDVYIVGKGQDPTNPNGYSGPAQDIAVYSTFVPCPN